MNRTDHGTPVLSVEVTLCRSALLLLLFISRCSQSGTLPELPLPPEMYSLQQAPYLVILYPPVKAPASSQIPTPPSSLPVVPPPTPASAKGESLSIPVAFSNPSFWLFANSGSGFNFSACACYLNVSILGVRTMLHYLPISSLPCLYLAPGSQCISVNEWNESIKYPALDPSTKALAPVAKTAGCLFNMLSPLLPCLQNYNFIWLAICLTKALHFPVHGL